MDYYEMKHRCSGSVLKVCWYCFWASVIILLLGSLVSCTTTKVVEVEKVHDVHHHHTDSVFQYDSIRTQKETTIMQLDSAAMAQYGIQIKSAERAWLVKTKELEYQIQRLMEMSATKDSIHDSIPVPYPVEKLVEKDLSWWQKTQIYAGDALLIVIIIGAGVWFVKKKKALL